MSFKKQKQKEASVGTLKETKTSTPNVPDWFKTASEAGAGNIANLSKINPQSLVPGLDPLQTRASDFAGQLNGGTNDASQFSQDKLKALINLQTTGAPQVTAASLLENLGAYMNPYTRDVVDTTLSGFDRNADQTRAQQSLDMAGSGAFGGSGSAITRAETEGNLARTRAATEAGLRSDSFSIGAGLSGQDAARRQQAATDNVGFKMQNRSQIAQNAALLASLGISSDANARSNIGLMSDVGAVNREVAGDQALAPFTMQDLLSKLYAGLNPGLFTGQTDVADQKTTGNTKTSGSSFGANIGFTTPSGTRVGGS